MNGTALEADPEVGFRVPPAMRTSASTLVLLVLLLSACGGSESTGPSIDPSLPPEDTRPPDPVGNATVSFSGDVMPLMVQKGCAFSGCHGRPAIKADLDLTSNEIAYNRLVNVAAHNEPLSVVVIPGNAEDSYLIKKLEGRHVVGFRMPWKADTLATSEIAILRTWIDEGARNN